MVRRIATVYGGILLALLVVGCENKTTDPISQVPATSAEDFASLAPVDSNPSMLSRAVEPQTAVSSDRGLFDEPTAPEARTSRRHAGGRVHTVQSGDTLYSLAGRYYDSGRQWTRIHQANQARIANPNRLQIGMKLIIP